MKKRAFILLLSFIFILGCVPQKSADVNVNNLQVQTQVSSAHTNATQPTNIKSNLNEFQAQACNTANDNNKCDRLKILGTVTQEQCCKELQKCCG